MAHGRLISRVARSVNVVLTFDVDNPEAGALHLRVHNATTRNLGRHVGKTNSIAVADIDNMATGNGGAKRSRCRSGRDALRLADRSASGRAETTKRGRHRKAGPDAGVDTGLLGRRRSVTESRSPGTRIDEPEAVAIGNRQSRARVRSSSAENESRSN